MKKNAIWYFLIVLVVMSVFYINSSFAYLQGLKIEKVSQDPDPALPNRLLNIKLKVINTDKNPVNLTLEIIPEYPFKPYRTTKEHVYLLGYQVENYAQIIDFKVLVNDSVPPGVYNLKIRYYDEDSSITRSIPITIENDEVVFDIGYVKIEPEIVVDEGKVEFLLRNVGTISAKDVKVVLKMPESVTILQKTNVKKFSSIDKNENVVIDYRFKIDPNIKPGNYKGTIEITYYNDDRTKMFSDNFEFGFIVGVKNEIYSYITEYELDEKTNNVDVNVNVVNKGVEEVRFVKVEVVPSEDYEIKRGIVYIGNIDDGDYESADLLIRPFKDNVTLKYRVEWTDYFGKTHSFEKSEKLNVVLSKEIEGRSNYTKYLGYLVIVLLAIFWIFMLVDAIQSESENKVKKILWIIVIILTLPLGALLYYLFGRNK